MMLSGMTPRLPSVAESSVRLFPSMERFWSNGATEKACIICRVRHAEPSYFSVCTLTGTCGTFIWSLGALTCIFSSFRVWLAETMSAFSPLSFRCRVLLLIPPCLVVFVTGGAAAAAAAGAGAAPLSPSFSRFAPSCDWKKSKMMMWYCHS